MADLWPPPPPEYQRRDLCIWRQCAIRHLLLHCTADLWCPAHFRLAGRFHLLGMAVRHPACGGHPAPSGKRGPDPRRNLLRKDRDGGCPGRSLIPVFNAPAFIGRDTAFYPTRPRWSPRYKYWTGCVLPGSSTAPPGAGWPVHPRSAHRPLSTDGHRHIVPGYTTG